MKKTIKGVSASILLALLLSGCADKESSVKKYIESGKTYLEQGDLSRASVQLRNAQQLDANNPDVYRYLAEIAERQQNVQQLYRHLARLERLEPADIDLKVKLAQLMLMVGQFDEAQQKATEILTLDDARAEGYLIRATVALQKGDLVTAQAEGVKSITLDPQNTDALTVLAGVHVRKGEILEALELLDEALVKSPEELTPRMVRVDLNRQRQRFDLVEQDLRVLITQHPQSEDFVLSLAGILKDTDRIAEAETILNNHVTQNPANLRAIRGLIELADIQGDNEKAERLLDQFIAQGTADITGLQFLKIERILQRGDTELALQQLAEMSKSDKIETRHRAQARTAELLFMQNKETEALAIVSSILQEDPQSEPGLLIRARYYLIKQSIDEAVRDLRVVLRNNPDSEAGLMLLGSAYVSSGSSELADTNFRQVLRLNPANVNAAVPVINRLLAGGDANRSEQILLEALRKSPNNESLMALLAQVRLMRNDWAGTREIVSNLESSGESNKALSEYLSGRIFQGQQQFSLAADRYEQALKIQPQFQRALEGFAYSYMQLGFKDDLIKWLDAFIAEHPQLVFAYVIKAAANNETGQPENAIAALEQGIAANPHWVQGYSHLASVLTSQNQLEDALKAYDRGIAVSDNATLHTLKASLLEQHGRYAEALQHYETAYTAVPGNQVILNNLATLLVDHDGSQAAVQRAVEITRVFRTSEEPYFVDTHAWALFKAGQLEEAERLLRQVTEKAPDIAVFNYHYGEVLLKRNKTTEALLYLQKAAGQAGDDASLKQQITEALVRAGSSS